MTGAVCPLASTRKEFAERMGTVPGMLIHTCNPSNREAEAGELLQVRGHTLGTERVQG